MTDETRKYIERTIIVLTEIVNGPPFHVRDKVKELIIKLEKSLE